MKKKPQAEPFSHYCTMFCVAFTIVIFCYSLLGLPDFYPALRSETALHLFLNVALVILLMYFTDKLPIRRPILQDLVRILDIAVPVFLIQWMVDSSVFSPAIVLSIFTIILLAYFGVYAVLILQNKAAANQINQKLREKRAKETIDEASQEEDYDEQY